MQTPLQDTLIAKKISLIDLQLSPCETLLLVSTGTKGGIVRVKDFLDAEHPEVESTFVISQHWLTLRIMSLEWSPQVKHSKRNFISLDSRKQLHLHEIETTERPAKMLLFPKLKFMTGNLFYLSLSPSPLPIFISLLFCLWKLHLWVDC